MADVVTTPIEPYSTRTDAQGAPYVHAGFAIDTDMGDGETKRTNVTRCRDQITVDDDVDGSVRVEAASLDALIASLIALRDQPQG